MTMFAPRNQRTTALVNGRSIEVDRSETLLQAALRQGIDFPNSCRVGGCGTCKCQLQDGHVKELTESGYLLSREELEAGYILACQSVPQTDVRVAVELAESRPMRRVTGRVTGREQVARDITRLRVQLDEALPYRAGQFAGLALEGIDGAPRSYSFATPATDSGQVSFVVRKVPGGRFSTLVNDEDVTGRKVTLQGPQGNFWLRPGTAPLLFIAGGSGLAPILSLLQEAAAAGETRPATLLFGARTQQDLYALEEIAAIARQWRGTFRFVPVLSEEPVDSTWTSARGLVTDLIPEVLAPGSHAYLCGPPAMIDGAAAMLRARGIPPESIHCDRFVTQHEAVSQAPVATATAADPAAATSEDAGLLHYVKFFGFHAVGLFTVAALLAGGHLIGAGLLAILALYIGGDMISGDDTTTPTYRHPQILTAQLWLALPLVALIAFAATWSVAPGDPLGFGAWVAGWSGYDVLAARAESTFVDHVATVLLTGLMFGIIGTITGHELTHRTWDKVSLVVGRWLLAFTYDTNFSIEHVYGHHRYVATTLDPATAPRGRNVYFHIVASTIKGNVSAWQIERERLEKRRLGLWSWHNAVLRGQAMSLSLLAAAWAMGGWQTALFFSACALAGKATLEIVNYMEHYGIVRDPATPVQPRHSWNTNRRISSWTMFNLTRHSHHHAQGEVPYQELRPMPEAPMMIGGYLTTIAVALIPPLWHALMTPKVLAWDRDYATVAERELARRASQGLARFELATRTTAQRDREVKWNG
ncbi:MAG: hypothetical protein QG550_1504 [Pseudomonadota bacterium]|nr:hypothetical protein [Pseudomonadota bacterium]